MSEITLALEHPSLGCGEIIARYDLSEIQEKAYQQGRADAIDEFVKKLRHHFAWESHSDEDELIIERAIEIAEQLKEQKE